jgi:tetratricopeptide (TPR) repeat protein
MRELLVLVVMVLFWVAWQIWRRGSKKQQRWRSPKRSQMALKGFIQALKNDRKTDSNRHQSALIARFEAISGKRGQAIARFTQAISLDPNHAILYFHRGQMLHEIGDLRAAYRDYCQSVNLAPEYADAYVALGRLFFDMGDFNRAIASCTQALSFDENHALAYAIRGEAYLKLENPQAAATDCDRALACQENHPQARRLQQQLSQVFKN